MPRRKQVKYRLIDPPEYVLMENLFDIVGRNLTRDEFEEIVRKELPEAAAQGILEISKATNGQVWLPSERRILHRCVEVDPT